MELWKKKKMEEEEGKNGLREKEESVGERRRKTGNRNKKTRGTEIKIRCPYRAPNFYFGAPFGVAVGVVGREMGQIGLHRKFNSVQIWAFQGAPKYFFGSLYF